MRCTLKDSGLRYKGRLLEAGATVDLPDELVRKLQASGHASVELTEEEQAQAAEAQEVEAAKRAEAKQAAAAKRAERKQAAAAKKAQAKQAKTQRKSPTK